MTSSRAEHISDTVEFLSHNNDVPTVTSEQVISAAAAQLSDSLQKPLPPSPFASYGNTQLESLKHLSTLFSSKITNHNTQNTQLKPINTHPPQINNPI